MPKPRLAIYDFTDCEGCQVELLSLKEKLLALEKRVEIVNWRLGQEKRMAGPFDIALIEGTPIAQEEISQLKIIRKQSSYLIGLGTCATLGGIPAIIDKKERFKWYRKIYGKKYQPRGIDVLPLSAYVEVDFLVHGCPINGQELVRVAEEILAGKTPRYRSYSVCFDCKMASNPCRIIDKKPCLGPIGQGGCGAICVSGGSPCYACFGLRQEPNIEGLLMILNKLTDKKEIERYFTMFLKRTEEYRRIVKPSPKTRKTND